MAWKVSQYRTIKGTRIFQCSFKPKPICILNTLSKLQQHLKCGFNCCVKTTVGASHASMPLFLFCLQFILFTKTPHMSEIIWHLSRTTWLMSLSLTLSRSTLLSYLFCCVTGPQWFMHSSRHLWTVLISYDIVTGDTNKPPGPRDSSCFHLNSPHQC